MRTTALVSALAGLTGLGVLAGFTTGNLTQPDVPVASGTADPLLAIPSATPAPARVTPLPDPTSPPALGTDALSYATRQVNGAGATLKVKVPKDWQVIPLRLGPVEARFRASDDRDNIYHLRAEELPPTLTPERAGTERESVLTGNETPDLRILGRHSGPVKSADGLTTRYRELVYTYTDVRSRRSVLVILRWVNGVELAATGRKMDKAGLEAIIREATESAEVVRG